MLTFEAEYGYNLQPFLVFGRFEPNASYILCFTLKNG